VSPPYRVEREAMPPGSTVQLFRVIVKIGQGWGTVQAGLPQADADGLCERLLVNERNKREAMLPVTQGRVYIPRRRRKR
jgi:hypothetical protein